MRRGRSNKLEPAARSHTRSMGQPMLMSTKSTVAFSSMSCDTRASESAKPPHTCMFAGRGGGAGSEGGRPLSASIVCSCCRCCWSR
eukprot:363312-Chlamydomonas_euryale.AAC.3